MNKAEAQEAIETTNRWKPYPSYKDSGIDWVGRLPDHWQIMPIWMLFSLGRGRVISNIEISNHKGVFPVYSSQTEDKGILGFLDTYDFDGKYLTWTTDGANAGTVFVREGKFNCTNVCGTLKSKFKLDYHFCCYTLNHATSWFVRQDINPKLMNNVMASIRIQFPPLAEQLLIAAFLDRETSRIDALIAKKQRQIELLQEKRTALISHAVIKGLNPDTKMKDSGIEWLGEIPEHWTLLSIKRLTLVKRGASPRPIDDPKYFEDEGEYAWVRIADVTASHRYLETTTQRLSELGKSLSIPLEPGDLFLSIAGTVGKPIITKIKCCIHDGFVYFPQYYENKEFLYYIFASGQPYQGLGKWGTQLNLNTDTVGGIHIGLPPRDEQDKIVAFLDFETQQVDVMIKKVNSSISLLQEYRTALISAAVTGKIDVRKEVA